MPNNAPNYYVKENIIINACILNKDYEIYNFYLINIKLFK